MTFKNYQKRKKEKVGPHSLPKKLQKAAWLMAQHGCPALGSTEEPGQGSLCVRFIEGYYPETQKGGGRVFVPLYPHLIVREQTTSGMEAVVLGKAASASRGIQVQVAGES